MYFDAVTEPTIVEELCSAECIWSACRIITRCTTRKIPPRVCTYALSAEGT